ncbi:hypothetical protein TELCIR_14984, partial [Teladorsagia circumcincta]
MVDMPLGVFRSVLKQQFMKNAHIDDIRIVDRLVAETRQRTSDCEAMFPNKQGDPKFKLTINNESWIVVITTIWSFNEPHALLRAREKSLSTANIWAILRSKAIIPRMNHKHLSVLENRMFLP